MNEQLVSGIHWLGHDSFYIEGDGLVIYIDPWKLEGGPQADLILITHEHRDHCSPPDVAKISKADTAIVTVAAAAAQLEEQKGQIKVVEPGDTLTVKDIPIQAVPAYNVNKFRSPGVPFHPKEAGHVGFILTVGGRRIYHAGDTDLIPEMATFETDVALLPVSGTYVMTADEAVEAAAAIQPRVVVPMHVGEGIGSLDDAQHFKNKAGVPTEILPLEK